MESKDCIEISDGEQDNLDASVLVIGEKRRAPVIDLTEESFRQEAIEDGGRTSNSTDQDGQSSYSTDLDAPVIPPLTPSPPPTQISPSSSVASPVKKKSPGEKKSPAKREELRRQKLFEKEEEKLIKEANRANAASKALQNCSAIIDKSILNLINDPEEVAFRTLFDESMISYRITEYQKIPNSVTWTHKRTEVEDHNCVTKFHDADWMIAFMGGREYLGKILNHRDNPTDDTKQSLKNYICDITRRSKCNLILIVFDLANYLKSERLREAKNYRKTFKDRFEASANQQAPEEDLPISSVGSTDLQDLRLMLEVELKHENPSLKFHIEFYEKTQDAVQAIARYTSSIAKLDLKRTVRSSTNLDWAINMDKERAVDPAKSLEDLTKLWITQLQQFSQITLPIAKSIAAEYPSPSALLDQYASLTPEEGENLLAHLHVQRNLKRQIGPNISKRIHCFMTCSDPDVHIGYG